MTRLKNEQLNLELISKQEQFNDFSSEVASTDLIIYLKFFRRLFKFLRDVSGPDIHSSIESSLTT